MHSESRSSIPLCVHGKLNVATTDRWRAPLPSLPTLHCALSPISPVCEQISVPHPALPPAAYTHTQVLHWVDRRPQRDSPGSKPWGLWAWQYVGVAMCGRGRVWAWPYAAVVALFTELGGALAEPLLLTLLPSALTPQSALNPTLSQALLVGTPAWDDFPPLSPLCPPRKPGFRSCSHNFFY